MDAESFGEDRCGESAGEGEQCAVAAGAAGDAVDCQALAQVLGRDVRPGLAAREQPAVLFAVGDALASEASAIEASGSGRTFAPRANVIAVSPRSVIVMSLVHSCAIRVSGWA